MRLTGGVRLKEGDFEIGRTPIKSRQFLGQVLNGTWKKQEIFTVQEFNNWPSVVAWPALD